MAGMQKPRLQFSLASLLATVAAVAMILALMFQVPSDAARQTLVALVTTTSALAITGLVNGETAMRTFCIGAIVPLGIMLVFVATNLPEVVLPANYVMSAGRPGTLFMLNGATKVLGIGHLTAIALGYLSIGFQILLVRRQNSTP